MSQFLRLIGFPELKRSTRLKIYGALLALGHTVGLIQVLLKVERVPLLDSAEAVCWPALDFCRAYKTSVAPYWNGILIVGIVLSIATAILFLLSIKRNRFTIAGWAGLLASLIFHIAILAIDYRLKHNQHLMHFTIDLAFLFFAQKQQLTTALLISFYFFAGLLKLTPEWWTGSAIHPAPFLVSDSLLPFAAKYVIVLECVFVWGLLARREWIRWLVLAQLIVFHLVSFASVGFYYPLLMFCLLSIAFFPQPESFRPSRMGLAFLTLFCLLQIVPRLLTRDSSLTMQGRLLALYMFDSDTKCEMEMKITGPNQPERRLSIALKANSRMHCEPVVFWYSVTNFCRRFPLPPAGTQMRAHLLTRHALETKDHLIAEFQEPCGGLPPVSAYYNSWVHEPE